MKVAILSMIYHEPEWLHTIGAIQRTCPGVPVYFAERNGVGGLAEAFNHGFAANGLGSKFDLVWFLTNFSWSGNLLQEMLNLEGVHWDFTAAVHPAFSSDHRFLRPSVGPGEHWQVPFVEFTAPLVNARIFDNLKLDALMPYTGHDVDWGHRVRLDGKDLFCYQPKEAESIHSYIRHSKSLHPATIERRKRREAAELATNLRLRAKYGDEWRKTLNYMGGI